MNLTLISSVNWSSPDVSFLYPAGTHPRLIPSPPHNTVIIDDDVQLRDLVQSETGVDCSLGGPELYSQNDLEVIFSAANAVAIITNIDEARRLAAFAPTDQFIVIINTEVDTCVRWTEAVLRLRGRRDGVTVSAPSEVVPDAFAELVVTSVNVTR